MPASRLAHITRHNRKLDHFLSSSSPNIPLYYTLTPTPTAPHRTAQHVCPCLRRHLQVRQRRKSSTSSSSCFDSLLELPSLQAARALFLRAPRLRASPSATAATARLTREDLLLAWHHERLTLLQLEQLANQLIFLRAPFSCSTRTSTTFQLVPLRSRATPPTMLPSRSLARAATRRPLAAP